MKERNRFDVVNDEIKRRLDAHNTAYIDRKRADFEVLLGLAEEADIQMKKRKRRKNVWHADDAV